MLNLHQVRRLTAVATATALTLCMFSMIDSAEAVFFDAHLLWTACLKQTKSEIQAGTLGCLSFIAEESATGECSIYSKNDLLGITPCDYAPCNHDGTCINNGADFTCNCPFPYGGNTCDDLDCGECTRKGKLVILTDTTGPSMSWEDSYNYCENKGMKMFMDISWTTHGFALGFLGKLIPDRSKKIAFWMGLNRTTTSDPFTYIDGNVLAADKFTDWNPNINGGIPGSNLCVSLLNTETSALNWVDQPCEGESDWTYYPLCQQVYDTLPEY